MVGGVVAALEHAGLRKGQRTRSFTRVGSYAQAIPSSYRLGARECPDCLGNSCHTLQSDGLYIG